ncbi:MAG: endopeptidase La [bacterium]|nr:endopeptidase La [bacterium]
MEKSNKENLPVLFLFDMVLFPSSEMRLELSTLEEKQIVSLAEGYFDSNILIVSPTNDVKKMELLPSVGIIAQIRMRMDMPNGKTRLALHGLKRVAITEYQEENIGLNAIYEELSSVVSNPKEEIACVRKIMNLLETYIDDYSYNNNLLNNLIGINNLDRITDLVAPTLPIDYIRKTAYIEEIDPIKRSKMIMEDINHDLMILELEKKLDENLASELEKHQKEYILREKIRLIKEELGDVKDKDSDIEILRDKVKQLNCNEKVLERLESEIGHYETLSIHSPEIGMIRNYIDWLLALPWNTFTKDNNDLVQVKQILDDSHYGLETVKERILEYLAVKQYSKNIKSPIICLVGPPGVGKTSLAKSIAESLNRNWTKISVGGIHDEAEIVGHRRTYIGAAPGLIVQGLKKAKSMNPVFIIDEIDKMTKDIKGDPASALLEILDPEQNKEFRDHYIEEGIDLSNVLFITTANYYDQIPLELLDRLEIIELSSYTEYEKLDIAKNYLIPREAKEHGIKINDLLITEETILKIVHDYTKEAGVRELSRFIASLFRKKVKSIVMNEAETDSEITIYNLEKYLGKPKYMWNNNDIMERVGVVNGMAYTPFGGDILPIEAVLFPGNGNIILTGSLGEVMKESAHLACDYLKSNYQEFKIDYHLFQKFDIHIHVPEGAVPKDGPSAGVTITTTLLSLLTNQAIHTNVAMTGEMTLRGKVLPIGGLKEKIIGASRNGIQLIFIPRQNERDLKEIPDDIKASMKIILVDRYQDIKRILFKLKRREKKYESHDPRNIRLQLD